MLLVLRSSAAALLLLPRLELAARHGCRGDITDGADDGRDDVPDGRRWRRFSTRTTGATITTSAAAAPAPADATVGCSGFAATVDRGGGRGGGTGGSAAATPATFDCDTVQRGGLASVTTSSALASAPSSEIVAVFAGTAAAAKRRRSRARVVSRAATGLARQRGLSSAVAGRGCAACACAACVCAAGLSPPRPVLRRRVRIVGAVTVSTRSARRSSQSAAISRPHSGCSTRAARAASPDFPGWPFRYCHMAPAALIAKTGSVFASAMRPVTLHRQLHLHLRCR